MPMSLMTSLNSVVSVLLVFMSLVQTNLYLTPFSNKAIVAYNVVKIQIERKELFSLHIARNDLSARNTM